MFLVISVNKLKVAIVIQDIKGNGAKPVSNVFYFFLTREYTKHNERVIADGANIFW